MVSEQRYIMLTQEEFSSGLHSFQREHDDVLSDGNIVGWSVGETETINVTIKPNDDRDTKQHTISINSKQVIDVLTRFCLENDIPIPRQSAKKWTTQQTGLALVITPRETASDLTMMT